MTVTAAEARVEYAGNGTATIFAFPYQFFQTDDLEVWLFEDATEIGVQQFYGLDFTVTGAMNPSGGNVTMLVAPPAGFTLIIINNPDIVQTLHYVNADDFPANTHEQGLDRLTKICQRLSDRVDRAVRAPDYAPAGSVPDAGTLVGLVEDAQQAANDALDSSDAAAVSATNARNSANAADVSRQAAANSAAAAAASATAAQVAHITWKNNWSAAASYAISDAVFYVGSSWIAKQANVNKDPVSNPSVWDMLAQQGAVGLTGPQGATGPAGPQGPQGATGAQGPAGSGAGDMLRSNNLSDVLSTATSRTNLGLGNSATRNIGTVINTVAAGDDPRFTSCTVSATPPVGAADNALWWETDSGLLYVRYNDGNTTQWVIACPQPDINSYILKSGDTMTGPLTVVTPPTAPAHAASKAYVDSALGGVDLSSKVSKTGDTMSGALTVTPKGSLFGNNSGNPYTGAVVPADANIKLYDSGSGNWCGMGADTNGNFWLRTGGSGTPTPAFQVDTGKNVTCTGGITSGAPGIVSGGNVSAVAGGAFYFPSSFGIYDGSPYRYMRFSTNWEWMWDVGIGHLYWRRNGVTGFALQADSTLVNYGATCAKPGGGAWADSSDIRIKNVHGDYASGLDEVVGLMPRRFSYKGNETNEDPTASRKEGEPVVESPHSQVLEQEFIGLVAQEAETVMPELVTQTTAWIDGKRVDDMRRLDSGPLIYALVNAVKELKARIEALEAA